MTETSKSRNDYPLHVRTSVLPPHSPLGKALDNAKTKTEPCPDINRQSVASPLSDKDANIKALLAAIRADLSSPSFMNKPLASDPHVPIATNPTPDPSGLGSQIKESFTRTINNDYSDIDTDSDIDMESPNKVQDNTMGSTQQSATCALEALANVYAPCRDQNESNRPFPENMLGE
jgi:hypothetical protein